MRCPRCSRDNWRSDVTRGGIAKAAVQCADCGYHGNIINGEFSAAPHQSLEALTLDGVNPLYIASEVVVPLPTVSLERPTFIAQERNSWGPEYDVRNLHDSKWFVREIEHEPKWEYVREGFHGPLSLADLHAWSNGIYPYLHCPWCGYTDCENEFVPFHAPYARCSDQGVTQCGQCYAAGATALFLLAYDGLAYLFDCEQYRHVYMSELWNMPNVPESFDQCPTRTAIDGPQCQGHMRPMGAWSEDHPDCMMLRCSECSYEC